MNISDTNILDPVGSKKTFFTHVFSTTEEGKAEILNASQYALLGIIPIVLLNKIIQKFIPEADPEKSSMEILIEVIVQILVMFIGIILIHRVITYIPTYSEFKYENLTLTNVVLAFMVIVLSIQTKLGLKVNILVDRVMELWNGPNARENMEGSNQKKNNGNRHSPSRGDNYDNGQMDMFPPAPQVSSNQDVGPDLRGPAIAPPVHFDVGPMSANSVLGGSFGSSF